MSCYLLKIPIEIRLRIYTLLLPDKLIPARNSYPVTYTASFSSRRVYTAFLRTNHQIYDEGVRVLYSARAFAIEVDTDGLAMCKSSKRPSDYGGHRLQDYQMQLMLLEQQNRRRLMMARQHPHYQQQPFAQPANNVPYYFNHAEPSGRPPIIPFTYETAEPAWDPPINVNHFNMIQSFLVEISFSRSGNQTIYPNNPSLSIEAQAKALESNIYDYCDNIHTLIGRFRLMNRPLTRLEVILKFGKIRMEREEIISAAQVLLRPFQRLRNIGTLTIPKITIVNFDDREIDILDRPETALSATDLNFRNYLNSWSDDLRALTPMIDSPVFKAYWQLERLLASIRSHHSNNKFAQFKDLIHTARMAREADDLASFREVWDQVVKIWLDYLDDQKQFQEDISFSIADIVRTIEDDS